MMWGKINTEWLIGFWSLFACETYGFVYIGNNITKWMIHRIYKNTQQGVIDKIIPPEILWRVLNASATTVELIHMKFCTKSSRWMPRGLESSWRGRGDSNWFSHRDSPMSLYLGFNPKSILQCACNPPSQNFPVQTQPSTDELSRV